MSITVAKSTKMTSRFIVALGVWAFVFCFQMGCNPGGASDVPCLSPASWPSGTVKFLVKSESLNGKSLLLAHQTSDQSHADSADGITGNDDIGPIYRFDPDARRFELVDRAAWDAAEGGVQTCNQNQPGTTSFLVTGFGTQDLKFEGRTVPVQGGHALSVHRSPRSLVSAVASAAGGASPPLFTSGGASGQHYHQLFSEVDGSPIGDPVRIGVGAAIGGSRVYACWTEDEEYVLYVETGNRRFQRICIVPITDPLPQPPEKETEEEPEGEDAGP